jgi:ribosome biogenesis GTPase
MAKRKLNRRQRWRVEKIQAEKAERLKKNEDEISSMESKGLEAKEEHLQGLIVARHGKQVDVLDTQEKDEPHNCHIRANIPDMVVGDEVVWTKLDDKESRTGVIESLCPRKTLLSRTDKHGQKKIIAANINQVFLVLACEPHTNNEVIDRYIAACEILELPVKILLNKSDLKQSEKFLRFLTDNYSEVVEGIFPCSQHKPEQMEKLSALLKGKNSVFIGQSGVGKSSLIKLLLEEDSIKTNELSKKSGLGQHTTSSSRLYLLEQGGTVIDSPGIREFDIGEVDLETLQKGFREIDAIETPCKFRNCVHDKEPECEVRKAVADGKIPEIRYENYLLVAEQLGLIK